MVFLLPFTNNDYRSAEAWMQWVIELGGCKTHEMILMPSKSIKNIDTVRDLAGAAFGNVSVVPDAEGIEGHPQGPNSMMRQAIWHCQVNGIGPWTFMEPDCIPTATGWADAWEREYRAFARPFMGELRPAHDLTPDYLTGNMVIPRDGLLLAPMLARRGLSVDGVELAFDIVAAKETLPQAHLTKLLQQMPKNEDGSSIRFPDAKALELLRYGAVLFHPCKDESLIERLRESQNGLRRGELDSIQSHKLDSAGSIPATATSIRRPQIRLEEENVRLRKEIERINDDLKDERNAALSLRAQRDSIAAKLRTAEIEIERLNELLKKSVINGIDSEYAKSIQKDIAKNHDVFVRSDVERLLKRKKIKRKQRRKMTQEQIDAATNRLVLAREAKKKKVLAKKQIT